MSKIRPVDIIHYNPEGVGGIAVCGMNHPRMQATMSPSKVTCSQCMAFMKLPKRKRD